MALWQNNYTHGWNSGKICITYRVTHIQYINFKSYINIHKQKTKQNKKNYKKNYVQPEINNFFSHILFSEIRKDLSLSQDGKLSPKITLYWNYKSLLNAWCYIRATHAWWCSKDSILNLSSNLYKSLCISFDSNLSV